MDIKNFLDNVCKEIKYKPVRESISKELELHIQEIKEEYINKGIATKEAEEKAVAQMGVAEEIGKKLNKIHKPKLDWKLLVLTIILLGFGILVAILKRETKSYTIENILLYMPVGIALGVSIYFFDYRKIKKFSNIIWIIASIIMVLSTITRNTVSNLMD